MQLLSLKTINKTSTFKMKYEYDSYNCILCSTSLNTHAAAASALSAKQAKVNNSAPDSIMPNSFVYLRSLPFNWSSHHTTYWQHSDHLGSASWVTDTNGTAYQHLQYMPWGEPLLDQRKSGYTYNTRYTFSGKERDEETGYGYFGARYYNSDLSIWLSVDPMADKYPGVSPYTYCANNPVRLVDKDGREIWKPEVTENGDIRLLAELGDNLNTLSDFLGGEKGLFSKRKILKMWNKRDEQNNVTLPKTNFSKAIKKAIRDGLPDEKDYMAGCYDDNYVKNCKKNYNCFGAALCGADGDPIGYYSTEDLDGDLEYGKWYSTEVPIFGKTLIRFAKGKKANHAAVFFGRDHSGNSYVFTKNGYYFAPTIVNINENISQYGPVKPLDTDTKRLQGNSGMYNYGKP